MKIEIELDPYELRALRGYAAAQNLDVPAFVKMLISRAIRPNEEDAG